MNTKEPLSPEEQRLKDILEIFTQASKVPCNYHSRTDNTSYDLAIGPEGAMVKVAPDHSPKQHYK